MQMLDFIVKNSVLIIENRIKDIIRNVAKEHNIKNNTVVFDHENRFDVLDLTAMLKMTDGIHKRMEIFTFSQQKSINRMPLNQIKGGITNMVEKYIAGVFDYDSRRFQVSTALVNYKFFLGVGGQLITRRNIAGTDYQLMPLKTLLFQK